MDITKQTTVETGSTVNTATGEAKVPNEAGGVDTKHVGQKYIFEDTTANRRKLAELFDKAGMHYEAADLRGESYSPTLTSKVIDFLPSAQTVVQGAVVIAIGALTYYVGKKAWGFISRKMGWSQVTAPTQSAAPEQADVKTFPQGSRRMSPTQMTASA